MSNLNKKKPRVAVLLAAWNGMQWIEQQVKSILKQERVQADIYINVDISDDGTYQWCCKLANRTPNIYVLEYGERYGCAAKNFYTLIKKVDLTNYDYISFCDQDDIWYSDKLHKSITTILNKNIDAYSSDVIAFWPDNRRVYIKKSYPQKKFDHYFESAGPGCTYVLVSTSMQKFKEFLIDNWKQVNNFESHDWLIYAFFRIKQLKWHIDNCPSMEYRQHEHNQVGTNHGMKAYVYRSNKIKSKWYRNEVNKIYYMLFKYSKDHFSLSTSFLLKNSRKLRRKPRDVLILFFFIIFRIF